MSATPNNQFEADRLRMVAAAMRKARRSEMHHTSRQEYSRLDAMFGELTVSERRVGLFLSL